MGLLKRLAYLLSGRQGKHKRYHGGNFHKRHLGRAVLPKTNSALTASELENEVCPMCKNHCSLSMPKCEKGKAYAREHKAQTKGVS
jgi:hypothetical protein